MNRLTEDLLALASVESPDYKLTLQPARASALVKDAIDSLGGIVVDSGVKLQSAGAPDDAGDGRSRRDEPGVRQPD